jgi:hypothetical protein
MRKSSVAMNSGKNARSDDGNKVLKVSTRERAGKSIMAIYFFTSDWPTMQGTFILLVTAHLRQADAGGNKGGRQSNLRQRRWPVILTRMFAYVSFAFNATCFSAV